MDIRGNGTSLVLPLTLIAVAVLLCFMPALDHGFLRYDDYGLLVNNPLVKDGSWQGMGRILSEFYASNYQPVVLILFRFLHALFGLNPFIFHLIPLLLHVANSCILYLVFNRIGVAQRISVLCVLLFALHPLRVEAIAWVYAGFSYTLSSFFFLTAVLSYLARVKNTGDSAYVGWPTMVLFGLAVLSKPVAIVLPLALCALDLLLKRPMNVSLLKEKMPLFLFGISLLAITSWAQHVGGATSVSDDFAMWERLVIPLKALSHYWVKTLWPVGLSVLVPYPTQEDLLSVTSYTSLLFLLVPWIAWFVAGDQRRPVLFGIIWYLVCIFPVLRFIPIGHSLIGDRYSYLPAIGLSLAIGAILNSASNLKMRRISLGGLSALTLLFAVLSWSQLQVWKNDLSLWKHAVSISPDSILAHTQLGSALSVAGRLKQAESQFQAVQRLAPDLPNADFGLGKLYGQQGEFGKSVKHFERVIKLDPAQNEAYLWLGIAHYGLGQWEEAYHSFQRAKKLGAEVPNKLYRDASRRFSES